MNNSIKPIETIYNGYRFRSRLEARWAVFFDEAGIEYQYEPEGFCGKDGTMYLPDFYLPWFSAYVEIKPKSISENDLNDAMEKCKMIFDGLDCITLLCIGDPYDSSILVLCMEIDDSGGGIFWNSAEFVEGAWFASDVSRQDEDYGVSAHSIRIVVGPKSDRNRDYLSSHCNYCCLEQKAKLRSYRDDFHYAKLKARQARFEHGESGYLRR